MVTSDERAVGSRATAVAPRSGASGRATVSGAIVVAGGTAALVAGVDLWLSARVRSGTDSALRLSVIQNYLGVDSTYVVARALGVAALALATLALCAGLESSGRAAAGQTLRPFLDVLHRQLGLGVVVLAAAHATVPYLSAVPPYGGWPTALVPFAQPFSWETHARIAESCGILALYLAVLVGPSYYLVRRTRLWSVLHRVVILVYALCVFHVLVLGSDFVVAGAPRVGLVALQVPVGALLARRLWVASQHSSRRPLLLVCFGVAAAGSVALAALAGIGAAGQPIGGFRL
jgi:predicted ferric reductase